VYVQKFIKIRFFSPIIFQKSHIELPWRISSDYIVRALTFAYAKLYNSIEDWFKALERDLIRVSSLIMINNDIPYFPDFSVKGYVSVDGDIIEYSDLLSQIPRVRIPREKDLEPTPFEDYILLTPKYDWGLILLVDKDVYNELQRKIIASLNVLGDFGLGARKTRGSGRFRIIGIENPDNYGVKVNSEGEGKLISRYIQSNNSTKIKKSTFIERTRIYYGEGKIKEFLVIAEGSELDVKDNGILEYFENDLGHKVPLYFRPLLLTD